MTDTDDPRRYVHSEDLALSELLDGLIEKFAERGRQDDFLRTKWRATIVAKYQVRFKNYLAKNPGKRTINKLSPGSRGNWERLLNLGGPENAGKFLRKPDEDSDYRGLSFDQVETASLTLVEFEYGKDATLPTLEDRTTWDNVFKAALADVKRQIKQSNERRYRDPEVGLRSPQSAPDSGSLPHREMTPVDGGAPDTSPLVPLQWDALAEPKDVSTKYASLTLRTGNSPPDQVAGQIHLGFDLHCPEDRTDTLITTLKRCLLTFDCAGGHTVPMAERSGNAGGRTFDGVCFSTYSTSIFTPSWTISASGSGGIGKVESIPATFVQIDGLRPGSSVKAAISADVKEIGSTFVLPEGEGQSETKKMIKKRLRQLDIVGGEDGKANLAMSEIKLMAKPDVANPDPKD